MKKTALILLFLKLTGCWGLSTTIYSTEDATSVLGTITFKDTAKGLEIKPMLHNLSPGPHGFHIHAYPSCKNKGLDAKSHFDPLQSEQHLGPYKKGHLGDLPKLVVNRKGIANTISFAPNLTLAAIKNHAVIIHEGGDNYQDTPSPLGGGGARIACGVID